MSFETVERLKREYTDKWVLVDVNTPELKRFAGLNGRIKTINMNGRALVQFDGPVDIGWYDIDLSYLRVIDEPQPKKATEKHAPAAESKAAAPKAPVSAAAPAAKPAAKPAGKSPLELAREQGAAKPAGKSPLELAREQGAAKPAGAPAPAAATTGDKPLSKLELARMQGAAKAAGAGSATPPAPAATPPAAVAPASSPAESQAPVEPPPVQSAPAAPSAKPAAMVDENGKPLSKLEMARRQGAFKGNS